MIIRFNKLKNGDKFTRLVEDLFKSKEDMNLASKVYCKINQNQAVDDEAKLLSFEENQQVFHIKSKKLDKARV